MARVVVTPSADADTAEIIADLEAKAGFAVAARYNASFERLYDILADFPGAGSPRPALERTALGWSRRDATPSPRLRGEGRGEGRGDLPPAASHPRPSS